MSHNSNEVKLLHRVINNNTFDVKLVWLITMLATGGRAIIPQEPYGEGVVFLLPSRSLALLSFTKMNDPRWVCGKKYIHAK